MTEDKPNIWLRAACILPGLGLVIWAWSDGTIIGGGPGIGAFDGLVMAFGAATTAAGFLPKRILGNYLAFFVMTMLMLAVTEVVLQNTIRGRYFSANDFDERTLFELRPGAKSNFTHLPINGGQTVTFRVNSDGFVGPELLPKGTQPRIIVYGDSFTHAEFTPQKERFTSRLQYELSARLGRDVEVINAGIAGYGPDQILRRIETEVPLHEPDLVIINVFTGNDFGDLLRNRLYKLDANGALIESPYKLSPAQQRQIALNQNELVLVRMLREARDWLFSVRHPGAFETFNRELAVEGAYEQHLREYQEFVVQGVTTVGEFSVDPYSVDIATEPDSPSARYKIELMTRIFERILAETQAAKVPLLAVAIPHPMDLLSGDHASLKIDPTLFPDYDPTRLTDTARAIAWDLGIPHVNLFDSFTTVDPNTLYLKGGDDHWNSEGQALAGRIVASIIEEMGFLAE